MRRGLQMALMLVALASAAALVGAADPKPKAEEIPGLVRRLGSPDWRVREAATKRLFAAGALAIPELKAGRGPRRGFLGVSFAPGRAPRIAEVVKDTAAERAGFQVGDLVYRVDRDEVATIEDVIAMIGYRFDGERVEITVERGGKLLTLPVRLGPRPPR